MASTVSIEVREVWLGASKQANKRRQLATSPCSQQRLWPLPRNWRKLLAVTALANSLVGLWYEIRSADRLRHFTEQQIASRASRRTDVSGGGV